MNDTMRDQSLSDKEATRSVLNKKQGHPTVRFGKRLFGRPKIHLRFSDLIAVKARDLFGKTSPQTFVKRGLINSYCFRREKDVV